MRELLSGALPAPQDEPQHRDVIDDAMDWGTRRRRRDWALSGAAALAVVAVGTGVAAMSGGGSGTGVNAGGQPVGIAATHRSMAGPPFPTGTCSTQGTVRKDLKDYCQLYNEQQHFGVEFAKGSVPYIQAALPSGFTVRATDTYVLILTGPDGKTNYMFPSTEPATTLDGHPLSCGVPARPDCVQTSTAGGTVVVLGNPSGDPSAGYVGTGLKDPRVDILLGTSVTGGMNGMTPPTSPTPLLTNAQLEKILGDPAFLNYAKTQLQHLMDITKQLNAMAPPSGASSSWSGQPSGVPSNPDSSSGYSSPSAPSGSAGSSGSWSSSPPTGGSWSSSPQSGGSSSGGSWPSSPGGSWSSSSSQSWPSSPSSPGESVPSSGISTPSSPVGTSSR